MNGVTFQRIAGILKTQSGMALRPDQAYHLSARLQPLAALHKLTDLDALAAAASRDAALARAMAEEAAIHETSFFRGPRHFDLLRAQVLPALTRHNAGRRRLRLWSAACATGQEVWSLAMILRGELAGLLAGWEVEIVGTDFSRAAVERAVAGEYNAFDLRRGLTDAQRDRWFERRGEYWRVRDELRQGVRFRQANLLDSAPDLGTFDVALCRHVLIYFDQDDKRRALAGVRARLADHGTLIMGGIESPVGIGRIFRSSTQWPGAFVVEGSSLVH